MFIILHLCSSIAKESLSDLSEISSTKTLQAKLTIVMCRKNITQIQNS